MTVKTTDNKFEQNKAEYNFRQTNCCDFGFIIRKSS